MKVWDKMIEEGREPPAAYFEQPEVPLHMQFYMTAFFDLSTERQIGMGIGPIPRSKMREYARELGVQDFDAFRSIIGAMDDEYLALNNASSKPVKDNAVAPDDVEGAKRLFGKLKTRAKTAHGKKKNG